jgi:hypothetical protein
MKLQRSTLVLVSVALLMGAGVLIAESQRPLSPDGTEVNAASGEPILPFEESSVTRLRVERNGETLTFELDEDGNWQMTEPAQTEAEPGAVAFLLSRLNTDAPLETVTMQPEQIADFGLDQPSGQVTVTLKDGTEHQLFLGNEDFSGSARYAIIDPETWPLPTDGDREYTVLVVSQDVANGINRPLAEWKLPVETADQDASTETSETESSETEESATEAPAAEDPATEESAPSSEASSPEPTDQETSDSATESSETEPTDAETSDDPEASSAPSDDTSP